MPFVHTVKSYRWEVTTWPSPMGLQSRFEHNILYTYKNNIMNFDITNCTKYKDTFLEPHVLKYNTAIPNPIHI